MIVVLVVNTTLNYSGPLATEDYNQGGSGIQTSTFSGIEGWSPTNNYPSPVWTQSCVGASGYIYCVGGLNGLNTATGVLSSSYYAQASSTGVSQWDGTTDYPSPIRAESCVTSGGYIYCVGGYNEAVISSLVYYAPISPSGIGAWTSTTSYPMAVWAQSCAAAAGEIYCVGGITGPNSNTSAVYTAAITSSGVGAWQSTTSYPTNVLQEACVASLTDVYCIGGYGASASYYAPITSSGLGQWTKTTSYESGQGLDYPACAVVSSVVYCVGGYAGSVISNGVYSAPLSASGIGAWTSEAGYPFGLWGTSCVSPGEEVVCVGGETASLTTNSVYVA